MIIEEPRKGPKGKILTIVVKCSTLEEASNYKLPLKYSWGYHLVEGILETLPYNKKFPYYRVIQRDLKKTFIKLK